MDQEAEHKHVAYEAEAAALRIMRQHGMETATVCSSFRWRTHDVSEIYQIDSRGKRVGKYKATYFSGAVGVEGSPHLEGSYDKNGKRTGDWITYHPIRPTLRVIEDSYKWIVTPYKNGLRHGKEESFDRNGNVYGYAHFVNGKLHGPRWDKIAILQHKFVLTGEVSSLQEWENDQRHGEQRLTYMNGTKAFLGHMHRGKWVGKCHSWWENGNLQKLWEYDGPLLKVSHHDHKGRYMFTRHFVGNARTHFETVLDKETKQYMPFYYHHHDGGKGKDGKRKPSALYRINGWKALCEEGMTAFLLALDKSLPIVEKGVLRKKPVAERKGLEVLTHDWAFDLQSMRIVAGLVGALPPKKTGA